MKIGLSTLLWGVILACCCHVGSAQDIHFSQFYLSPLNLNPALTGVMEAEQRFTANLRNQWSPILGSGAYQTYSLSYDRRFEAGQTDYFGLGVVSYADIAGDSKFGTSQFRISAAYTKKIGGSWSKQVRKNLKKAGTYLSVGTDFGIGYRSISESSLRWPSQVRNGVFDPSQGGGEVLANNNFIYPELTAGLVLYRTDQDGNSLFVGASMHHLNQANVNFLTVSGNNVETTLNTRLTVHGGAELVINKGFSFLPNIVYMSQGPHQEILPGAAVKFNIDNGFGERKNFFEVGMWGRLVQNTLPTSNPEETTNSMGLDAMIFYGRLSFGTYNIGLSYDYNNSGLAAGVGANGSFEISLQYLIFDENSKGYLSAPRLFW